jgi:eukaryotic-like serine/threonine-protein kinase
VALAAGARLGPYEVVGPLGAGGMGEVYQARDTRLARTVAIKVLPEAVAVDPERRRRFEQEARAVSALNHPHICVLHDIGAVVPSEADSGKAEGRAGASARPVPFLVMEYLDGQTLAERLAKGPLPLDEALALAAQVADALAAAHRAGIVHRDLKPANVMLVKAPGSGVVSKLLDFGLARLAPQAEHRADEATRTESGMVLGTAPYMAPEQVEGRPTDARTDLFAFGAVLYEMLTGQRAFEGTSAASIMAAIVGKEPRAASTLQPTIPAAIDRVIKRCLAKDPDARWQSAGDLAYELRWLRQAGTGAEGAPAAAASARRPRVRAVLALSAALLLVAGGAVLAWWLRQPAIPAAGLGLTLYPAEALNAWGASLPYTVGGSRTAFAWTPDGRALVFVGWRGTVKQLYVRPIDADEARPLDKTLNAQVPAVSPDGQWVAFWEPRPGTTTGAIRKVRLRDGALADLAAGVAHPPRGMAWDDQGRVFFGRDDGRIWMVDADGASRPVTTVGEGEVSHVLPVPLPGGRVVLYTVRKRALSWGDEQVVARTLSSGDTRPLLTDAADARYVPTGHLVFMRRGALMAVAFDTEHLEVRGAAETVLGAVAQALTAGMAEDVTGAGQFAFAATTGALAWIRSPVVGYPNSALVAIDRRGQVTRLPSPPRPYVGIVRVSPDGRRLAVPVQTHTEGGVWVYDLERRTLDPVFQGGETEGAVWWPKDGRRLVFDLLANGRPSLAWQAADGSGAPQPLVGGRLYPSTFTPDASQLVAVQNGDIVVVSVANGHVRVEPMFQTADYEYSPELSPDGRWLAYTSAKSGRSEVYVRPFPGPGAPERVSTDGGYVVAWNPTWKPRGGELFFAGQADQDGQRPLVAVDFGTGTPPRIGPPTPLFKFRNADLAMFGNPVRCADIALDGQHFYAVQSLTLPSDTTAVTHLSFKPNWFAELKAKVPR